MRTVIDFLSVQFILDRETDLLHIFVHGLHDSVIIHIRSTGVVSQSIDSRRAVSVEILPSVVVDHRMSQSFRDHVINHVTGDVRALARFEGSDIVAVSFMDDPAEQIFFFIRSISVVLEQIKRSGDDESVEFFSLLNAVLASDSDQDLAFRSLDFDDFSLQHCRMFQFSVDALVDLLRSILPGPKTQIHEFQSSRDIQVLHDQSGRDLIEETVPERSERSDPDPLDFFHTV